MVKKIISIAVMIVGALMVIGGVAPMIIGAVLEAKAGSSVGIIGGADGPTAVLVVGTLGGMGSMIAEVLIGGLLVAVGIWGCRKGKR